MSNYITFLWKTCTKTIEAIKERALRFMFNDRTSTYSSLLGKCNYTTFHIGCIKAIASEVFKSLNNLNPNFINKIFQENGITYDLRDFYILCQPKFNKITYSKNTFNYYGTHIWNSLPNWYKAMHKSWQF